MLTVKTNSRQGALSLNGQMPEGGDVFLRMSVFGQFNPSSVLFMEENCICSTSASTRNRYSKILERGSTHAYTYKDYVTNEEVRAKIQQAIGPHKDLLTTVKRRKLHWYGHVSCSSGLAKTILQGTVKGGRRQSRQRKKW